MKDLNTIQVSRGNGIGKPSAGLITAGWIFSVLGGLIGIFIACSIAFGKNGATYRYDDDSRRTGRSMLIVSIAVIVGMSLLRTLVSM